MSEAVLPRIESLLKGLNQPVFLLDRQGHCLVPRHPDTFILPANLPIGKPVSKAGYLFLALNGLEPRILASRERPEASDILLLCAHLIGQFSLELGITGELENALKRLVKGELDPGESAALANDHAIARQSRAVLLISLAASNRLQPKDSFVDFVPLEKDDLFFHLDSHNLILARSLNQDEPEDLLEYAMALMDTLQNELGLEAAIGIGGMAGELAGLRQSYLQARQAIRIGRLFHPNQQIFEFHQLVLERFMMDCSTEESKRYISLLFNPRTAKLFSDEMLETVHVFLKRDLNLTDAARDLYIHRNTLVYRLDKIQKGSGLDLRHFRDAMLFKLLDDLRKKDKDNAHYPEV